MYHAPSLRNVKDLLKNWDAIQEVPAVLVIIDKARTVFGRDNLFDYTSKITLIMDEAKQDPVLVRYLFESLYSLMERRGEQGPIDGG